MSIKYLSVYKDIIQKINDGFYANQTRLPSEAQLMEQYHVSRQTVRSALTKLKQEGFLMSSQGSGTFVTNQHQQLHLNRVALIMFQADTSAFPIIIQNIEKIFSEKGINLMLFISNASISKEKEILERLIRDPVDGILFYPLDSQYECLHTDLLEKLDYLGTRILFIEAHYHNPELARFPYVSMDNYRDTYQITTRLIADGHQKIGCVGFFHGQISQRFCGMRKALYDNNIPLFYSYDLTSAEHGALINQIDSNYSMCLPSFTLQLLECTALICFNDILAEALTDFLLQNGHGKIRTLVVYGNTDVTHIEGIHYILLRNDTEKIARLSAEKLLNEISGKKEFPALIPHTLIDPTPIKTTSS